MNVLLYLVLYILFSLPVGILLRVSMEYRSIDLALIMSFASLFLFLIILSSISYQNPFRQLLTGNLTTRELLCYIGCMIGTCIGFVCNLSKESHEQNK